MSTRIFQVLGAIIFRGLLLLSSVSFIGGTIAICINYPKMAQSRAEADQRVTDAPLEYTACLAKVPTDDMFAMSRCHNLLESAKDSRNRWNSYGYSELEMNLSFVALSLLVWPVFFALRWIFTGRLWFKYPFAKIP